MDRGECLARVGTTLRGKWKLERLIGVGGMAAVYVAHHKIGRDAAIKVMHPEIAVDEGVRERFEQEALAVNSIGHASVVEILDIDETEDGCPFLVMELLDGETLADRAERQPKLPIKQILEIVDQLLDVLAACHRKGIIHRDIKPENLFIQTDRKLKVLDFGIVRMREGIRTMVGTMLGTVAFMPPEQLRGASIDGRADIFSTGATMFSVITGRRIHVVENDTLLAMKMLSAAAPPLRSVAEDVPEGVGMVVDRALAYLPDRRYPDAQTMRGDVWALQRNELPPYARACIAADLDPHVLKLPPKDQKSGKPRTTGELPATDPQLPAFAGAMPPTDPQIPAFADAKKELPPTKPDGEMAALRATEDADDAKPKEDVLDDGDDSTNKKWPVKVDAPSEPPEDTADEPADGDSAPMSDPPPSAPPISEPRGVDAAAVARKKGRSGGGLLLVAVVLLAAAGAAWWTGVIPGRRGTPSKAPTAAPLAQPK